MSANNQPFLSYTIVDGLSNNSVKAIIQDSIGFMWFGTKDGLNRYDGYEFKIYPDYQKKSENELKESGNDITNIFKDQNHNLWIGTFNGIKVFNPYTETYIRFNAIKYPDWALPKGVVTGFLQDKNRGMWVSTKIGLYLIDYKKCSQIKDFVGSCIMSIEEIDKNRLLIYVNEKGLAIYNRQKNETEYINDVNELRKFPILKMLRMVDSSIWLFANSDRLFKYDIRKNSVIQVNIQIGRSSNFESEIIHDITPYNDSTLLLATDAGVLVVDSKSGKLCDNLINEYHLDAFNGKRIMSVYKDSKNDLWIGTFTEGVKFCSKQLHLFNYYDLFSINQNSKIVGNFVEFNKNLIFGFFGGLGLFSLDSKSYKNIDIKSQIGVKKQNTEILTLYGQKDLLYFYVLNKGLFEFDLRKSRITKRIPTNPSAQIKSITKDFDGNLWLAEDNLTKYNTTKQTLTSDFSSNYNNITNNTLVQDILTLKNGDILLATRTNGVIFLPETKNSELKYFHYKEFPFNELNGKNAIVLFQDSKENIWIGTYNSGLYVCNVRNHSLKHFVKNKGLTDDFVCSIVETKSKNVWVATRFGITNFGKKQFPIVSFSNKSGFPIDEISQKALYQTSDGLIYVGGDKGIASFDPSSVNESRQKHEVRLIAVETVNPKEKYATLKSYSDYKKVEIPFDYASIQIKYSALNFAYGAGTKYSYKLDGVDKDWNITDKNVIQYLKLWEGKYTFLIRTVNSVGYPDAKVIKLKIEVLAPWWRTLWAKFMYFVLLITLSFFIFRYYLNQKNNRFRELLNQKEKENLEKYYQLKIDLFTKFSHELRTPLTLISGPANDLLRDDKLPEKFINPVKMIYKNTNRLLLTVNQLLDFRKLEQGAMSLNLSNVKLIDFINDRLESFTDLCLRLRIKIITDYNLTESNITFDPNLIEKVLFNLITNAIKHSNQGSTIWIKASNKDQKLTISVRDEGIGISEENLKNIFEPFFQERENNQYGFFGTGLGLNLAKYILSLHKGKIWVESVINEGATFYIEIPLTNEIEITKQNFINPIFDVNTPVEVEKSSLLTIEEDFEQSKQSNSKISVLIAEDDDDLRQYINSLLSSIYQVFLASNGEEAIEKAREIIPDIIISDVMMPLKDGYEVCRILKNDFATEHIPIILLTACSLDEQIRLGYELLADDYILKPFNSELLIIRVQNIVDNRTKLRLSYRKILSDPDLPTESLETLDPFMAKLIGFIKENISNSDLSIIDLTNEINMSRAQFFRKFKAISDVSPSKFILNIRMKIAAEMLKEKNKTISEVAYDSGFSDPAYFSKTFKNYFGVTPTEYINN
jgi:signal transduction histidine kinase/ligand-binding sensor domain-containing protein/DNA-binding response OmpR family regulator